METKDKINGNRGICRAMINPPTDEQIEVDILNEFTAIAVPTENKQLRYSFENNEFFYQVLRTGKENIITSRLDSGLPLFDNHPEIEDAGALCQLGITRAYEFLPEGVSVTCEFGARADNALRSDVKKQVVKTVSIEGDVYEYSIVRTPNDIPTYYAEKWEPSSLSFAPIPQDIGAQIDVKRAIQKQIEQPKPGNSMIKSLKRKF